MLRQLCYAFKVHGEQSCLVCGSPLWVHATYSCNRIILIVLCCTLCSKKMPSDNSSAQGLNSVGARFPPRLAWAPTYHLQAPTCLTIGLLFFSFILLFLFFLFFGLALRPCPDTILMRKCRKTFPIWIFWYICAAVHKISADMAHWKSCECSATRGPFAIAVWGACYILGLLPYLRNRILKAL